MGAWRLSGVSFGCTVYTSRPVATYYIRFRALRVGFKVSIRYRTRAEGLGLYINICLRVRVWGFRVESVSASDYGLGLRPLLPLFIV